ncbi:hypothetical protein V6N13_134280 [Hibiscus sabdariffa]|uniref:Uncharacterized protein n=1 Tax=Hibiscus sabdariffa TaxID=183260 RepID=A0ABR2R440_9ROSI
MKEINAFLVLMGSLVMAITVQGQHHLWMVQTVPSGYCAARPCTNVINSDVIVHGLWPVDSSDSTLPLPCRINLVKKLPGFTAPLSYDMHQFWPTLTKPMDEDLWNHEWTYHGRCQSASPLSYFSMGINLYKRIDLASELSNMKTSSYYAKVFRNKISQIVDNKQVMLRCAYVHGTIFLSEVIVCVDMAGQHFIDCNKSNKSNYDNCPGNLDTRRLITYA